jgi:hypothetical protein
VEDIARARGASIASLACDPIGHCAMLETVPCKKNQHRTSSSVLRGPRITDPFEPSLHNIATPPPTRETSMQYLTPTPATGCINAKTNEYRRTIVDLCDNPPTARIPSN